VLSELRWLCRRR